MYCNVAISNSYMHMYLFHCPFRALFYVGGLAVATTPSPGGSFTGASQSVDGAVGPSDESMSLTTHSLIIPIAAMGTIAIVAVCVTVSLVILQRWRLAAKIYTSAKNN